MKKIAATSSNSKKNNAPVELKRCSVTYGRKNRIFLNNALRGALPPAHRIPNLSSVTWAIFKNAS